MKRLILAALLFATPALAGPDYIASGQVKIANTGTAVQIPSASLFHAVAIKAYLSNVAVICIGGSSAVTNTANGTGNGFCLVPGESVALTLNNASSAWVNGQAGDFVYYIGD